jgi:hypothetical protein
LFGNGASDVREFDMHVLRGHREELLALKLELSKVKDEAEASAKQV